MLFVMTVVAVLPRVSPSQQDRSFLNVNIATSSLSHGRDTHLSNSVENPEPHGTSQQLADPSLRSWDLWEWDGRVTSAVLCVSSHYYELIFCVCGDWWMGIMSSSRWPRDFFCKKERDCGHLFFTFVLGKGQLLKNSKGVEPTAAFALKNN